MTRIKADKDYWSKTYAFGRLRIYAWERLDRGGRIHVKFTSPLRRGRDRRVKMKLDGDLTVRDGRGRIDHRLVREVDATVNSLGAQLTLGQPTNAGRREDQPLVLAEGFRLALDLERGKFPAKTRRWEEVKRASQKLERILGANRLWTDITPADARRVWRSLAEAAKRARPGQSVCGPRQTEVTVDALYSIANWLRDEEHIPQTAALPSLRWRRKLYDEWQAITGSEASPSRPRHTADDMRRLFAHLNHPGVDPRFALVFDLGAEQRVGQVLRLRRSQVELPAIDRDVLSVNSAGPQLGVVKIGGAGKKKASPIALTIDQRNALEAALAGYLADYECAWREGVIDDYPLFPAGRLKKGKAKIIDKPKCLSRDAARKMFRKLEEVAGVESVAGRAWYGVRRVATDIAEDIESDERVLNSLTGHRDSTTRRLVYQDHERPELLARAATTRDRIRKGVVREEPAVPETSDLGRKRA